MSGRRTVTYGYSAKARGFSLLEVIVAFALLAIGLGILIGILSGGVRQVRTAQTASEATLYAQSLLDTLGAAEPIEPGETSGEFDHGRYRWRLDISEYADPLAEAEVAADREDRRGRNGAQQPRNLTPAGLLYRVALDVEWGRDDAVRRLRFVTLRALAPDVNEAIDAEPGRSPVPEEPVE